jgi:dihydrofolate reductase
MGRFVYWMNTSLDLFIERTAGEDGGGEWLRITEELHREFNTRAAGLSLMVEGRVIYEIMEPFWPVVAQDASQPDYLREPGAVWTQMPKVMVSNTRTGAGHNTRVVGGPDAIGQLAAIREETVGAIGVGGATLATALLAAGLLDELMLFTHPVVLGRGRPLFDGHDGVLQLDLLEQASYDRGVTLHRYALHQPA